MVSLVKVLEDQEAVKGLAKEVRCLIFVERKLVAQALAHLLRNLQMRSFSRVEFVYSANSNKNVKDPQERQEVMSLKVKMKSALRNFRTGATQILVATSVVEEGIDVPKCNLVIKFDFPTTYRSYIQSKGRARAAGSSYILLLEQGDSKKEQSYNEWMEVYRLNADNNPRYNCYFQDVYEGMSLQASLQDRGSGAGGGRVLLYRGGQDQW